MQEADYTVISIKDLPRFTPATRKGKWTGAFNTVSKGKAVKIPIKETNDLQNIKQSLRVLKKKGWYSDLEIRSDGQNIYVFKTKDLQDSTKEQQ